jgi:hypothetical protein
VVSGKEHTVWIPFLPFKTKEKNCVLTFIVLWKVLCYFKPKCVVGTDYGKKQYPKH